MTEYFMRADGSDELACRCGCGMTVQDSFRVLLNKARELAGIPFKINSGARCKTHNARVGGSSTSSHVGGIAVDIGYSDEVNMIKIVSGLARAGFVRLGVNTSKKFIHADTDASKPAAVWDYSGKKNA
jgi:zinc D-Ala-D-Ala carboxypeptidase